MFCSVLLQQQLAIAKRYTSMSAPLYSVLLQTPPSFRIRRRILGARSDLYGISNVLCYNPHLDNWPVINGHQCIRLYVVCSRKPLPAYISSYACKHFQSGNLLVKLYVEHFYEHNEKSTWATLETYVPLELSNICLKHGIHSVYKN